MNTHTVSPAGRRTRLRVLGSLVALTTLVGGVAAAAVPAPASAVPTGAPSVATATRPGLLGGITVPELPPVRVPDNGVLSIPVRNSGLLPVTFDASTLVGSPTVGGVLSTVSSLVGAATSSTLHLTLTPQALQQLKNRAWQRVTVQVVAHSLLDTVTIQRQVMLIAPSVTTASATNPGNPLAGRSWANYEGREEPATAPYDAAQGLAKDELAKIEYTPKARWFVSNLPPADLGKVVRSYIDTATAGNPGALVQLTMFVLDPWETAACDRMPTKSEIRLDRAYIQQFVQAIGSAHAAVVVQPDGPYAGCEPHGAKILTHLVASAVHQLAQLPNTAAYVDMGSADWHRGDISKELPLLISDNVAEARGISLDVTHTDSTSAQVLHGDKLIKALAAKGITGKHVVVDTSDNGTPFGGAQWRVNHPNQGPWAAPACQTKGSRLCVSLGIPPTTDVANPRWGMSDKVRRLAAKEVDAYLWIKRPWLDPFNHYHWSGKRAVAEIRSSPFWG